RLVWSGVDTAAGVRRDAAGSRRGPWVCRTARAGHLPRWLSAHPARAGGRRARPILRESRDVAGHAEWGCPGVTLGPIGGGVSLDGPTRHWLAGGRGGDGRGHRGTVGCRGTRMSPGGAALASAVP